MSGDKHKNQGGFVALLSIMIISVTLSAIVMGLSVSGFFARFNILGSQLKETSFALARSCVDIAIVKYGKTLTYNGNEDIAIGTETCHVFPFEVDGGNKVIKAQAEVEDVYTNLKVTMNPTTLSIVSWEEIASF